MSYQDSLDKVRFGEQVQKALHQGNVRTPDYAFEKDETFLKELRLRCVRAVYALWGMFEQPASLSSIYDHVTENILRDPSWKHALPLKRTIDRRVNETADKRFWPDEKTPCIAVRAGWYIPSPLQFNGRARVLLDALCHEEPANLPLLR